MISSIDKPFFTLHLTAPDKYFSWCIALNGEVIHRITDFISFAKHVGYPEVGSKISYDKSNNEIDSTKRYEFISDHCTQTKIATYLYDNCEQFRKEYEEFYLSVIKTCKSHRQIYIEKCTGCMMLNKLDLNN